MWAFIFYSICAKVCGELVNDVGTVKVMKGHNLNLHPGLTDLKGDVQILWTFESGPQSTRVAQLHHGKVFNHYEKRFAGRVHLDQKTGNLTITDIRTNESGLYKALIIKAHISEQTYKVYVYAPVSVPAIRRRSSVSLPQSKGTSQETMETCPVICSVRNDQGVFLSWYKGDELVNQSSSPDLNISLSLALELHSDDPQTYSCTAVNPVSQKSVRLHIEDFCAPQEDCQDHCGATEALIRLVLSGLVGIATILFLIDHVFSV